MSSLAIPAPVFLYCLFVCFCCFTSQVNSYGHGGMVSSTNHTFSWASLNKQLTSTSKWGIPLYSMNVQVLLELWHDGRPCIKVCGS